MAGAIAAGMVMGAAALPGAAPAQAQGDPISIAFGDIASVESLNLLIAIERVKERGVPVEVTFFNSEDVAAQAVVSGQADIGIGAPYAFIQNSGAPVRMFYRMSRLLFFPVVNSEVYSGWQDLDGEEVTVHSRGSGTEALMRLMESREGISYSNVSYIPGSEVRAGAMLQGRINATIVDAAAFRLLQEQGGDKFQRLPLEGVDATDEALYANQQFLEERAEDVAVLVEELLKTWQEIDENPEVVVELREQYDLLPDLPEAAAADAGPYYVEAVEGDVYPTDGGSPDVVQQDLEFLAAAGQVEASDADPEDYWDFGPLERAKGNLGQN
ncbi:hypothetical protein N177_3202 [Lutibaculum baratangense AMV1]|uniref:SsuA/THI5-like domain-containing protein n=1 Tax=Lutibaculum baratangense AMV1 TaxID=631454 RepID=V4RCK8_9HYPH|nr:hypothetical protein N177_3202 [Lutibaculum baratangense AMV1]